MNVDFGVEGELSKVGLFLLCAKALFEDLFGDITGCPGVFGWRNLTS
jgi:hypothetical protein